MTDTPTAPPSRRGSRLILVALAVLAVLAFLRLSERKAIEERIPPLTETQRSSLVAAQGPELLKDYGGESKNAAHRALVARVGEALATQAKAKHAANPFRFTVLAESNQINSFALPTGDVFVTTALVNRMRSEGELAAALAQGIAHSLAGDVMRTPLPATGDAAPAIPQFTLAEELAADTLAVKLLADAGYNPHSLVSMIQVLGDAYHAKADVPYFISHPSTEHRLDQILEQITLLYPDGVPEVLSK